MTSYKKMYQKLNQNAFFWTDARGHLSPQYLWIKVLRTLEIHQITNAI